MPKREPWNPKVEIVGTWTLEHSKRLQQHALRVADRMEREFWENHYKQMEEQRQKANDDSESH